MKKPAQSVVIAAIMSLRYIVEIFAGPFLTAYLIRTSESTLQLSIFYLITLTVLGISAVICCGIIVKRFQRGMYRLGMILNFCYILSIALLEERVLDYLPLIAILYGVSMACYFMPNGLYNALAVSNENRARYEFIKTAVNSAIGVIVPITLGSLISATNFTRTAFIILAVSGVQVLCTFLVEPVVEMDHHYTPVATMKRVLKQKEARCLLLTHFSMGCTINTGALGTVVTSIFYLTFRTDTSLGIITSTVTAINLVIRFLHTKFLYRKVHDKWIVGVSFLVMLLGLAAMLLIGSSAAVVAYYIIYAITGNMINWVAAIRINNAINSAYIKDEGRLEFLALSEVTLMVGRIFSFGLMVLVSLWGSPIGLYLLDGVLTLTILLAVYGVWQMKTDGSIAALSHIRG